MKLTDEVMQYFWAHFRAETAQLAKSAANFVANHPVAVLAGAAALTAGAFVLPGIVDALAGGGVLGEDVAAPLFGQTSASAVFGNGQFAGQSIGEVASAVRAGEVATSDLPVDVIIRDGETIGLNTRSMLALRRAGVPVSDWTMNDVSGNPAMERLLTERLARNGLSRGTTLLRITGVGRNASSLR